jgi:hypothetical protein
MVTPTVAWNLVATIALVAPIKNRVLGGKWIWVEPNLFNKFAFLIEER